MKARSVVGSALLAPLCAVWIAACSPAGEGAPPEPAIPFQVERMDGSVVGIEDLRGRLVLVDFWATWCPPCLLEIPELNAVYERYRDSGFEVLAISIDDIPREELREWLAENDVHYPVAIGDEEIARQYGAFGFPYHVLLSPEGTILERLTPGFHDRQELGELLDRYLPG